MTTFQAIGLLFFLALLIIQIALTLVTPVQWLIEQSKRREQEISLAQRSQLVNSFEFERWQAQQSDSWSHDE